MRQIAEFFRLNFGRVRPDAAGGVGQVAGRLRGEAAAKSGGGLRNLNNGSQTNPFRPCASAGPAIPWNQAIGMAGGRVALVLLALLSALAGPAAADGEKPRIRIGVEINSPPLSFVNAQEQPDGFAAELLREMARTGDLELEIVPGFWSFVLGEFHAGRLDALANVTITDERRATMDFSIGHASLHAITYTRPGVPPFRHTAQFAGRVMGTLNGTIGHSNAVRHGGWGARIVLYDSWADMLQAVKNGDCDFALLMRPLKFEQPDEMGLHREFVDDIIHQFHMAVRRGDARTLERINEALATLRANGTYDRLYAKWIGPIEPHPIRLSDLRPYYLPGGLILLMVAALFVWQRIVNRRLRQQALALHESEEKYRMLVDNAHESIYVVQDGVFRFVNATMLRLTGLTADQLLGRSTLDLLRTGDHDRANQRRESLLSGQADSSIPREFQVNLPNGRELWVALAGVRISWQGRPATLNFASDITVSRRAELARQEAAARLEKIADHVPGVVYQYRLRPDGSSCFPYASEGMRRIYGLDPEAVREDAAAVFAVLHPDDRGRVTEKILQSARELIPWEDEYRVRLADGSVRWLLGSALPEREADGAVLWHGHIHDITGRKQLEAELALREARFRAIFDHAPVGISLTSAVEGIQLVNAEHVRITGVSEVESKVPGAFARVSHPEDYARQQEAARKFHRGELGHYTVEKRYLHPDGREQWAELTSRFFIDPTAGGKVILTILTDIAERKRSEAALQASLLEKISLLNEVHHRVKNNLQVVMSLLRLEAGRSHEPAAQAVLKDMQGRIRSMALLHETLYRSGNFAKVNLADYLRQLSAQLFRAQNLDPGSVRLACELSPVEIEIDQAIPCGLIVNELVANSLKHAFPGGAHGEVRIELRQGVGREVRLRVSDTGVGLPADFDLRRLNSLGLQLVSDLARQLLGTLEIGPGASFTVVFTPRSVEAAQPKS